MRPTIKLIFVSTFLFGFAAHAFRYFNLSFSHDSLMVFQTDASWQISLGRFLQPAYLLLRGQLCAPFLIGLFSLLWLAAAIYLLVSLLGLKSPVAIILICGMLSTNSVVSLANATYIPWSDIYMLALLFSVLGVYLQRRYRFGFLLGALSVSFALALYQSYFEVAVFLSLILLVKDCFDRLSAKEILIRGIKALCTLLLGLVFYFVCLKAILALSGIELSTSYNGLANIGTHSETSILKLLAETYVYSKNYILSPTTFHPVLAAVINIAVIVLSGIEIIVICLRRKLPRYSILFVVAFVLLIPLGINIVYFISSGLKHALMAYSFYFIYVFAFLILDCDDTSLSVAGNQSKSSKPNLRRILTRSVMTFGIGILVLNNIIYANHLYLKKELEYQTTLSAMTRVLDRMEQTEGYVINETPVVIIGLLEDSDLAVGHSGFAYINAAGMTSDFSVTYLATYGTYFRDILGYPIELILDEDTINAYTSLQEVQSMPAFPETGSCIMIDGVLVIKLS